MKNNYIDIKNEIYYNFYVLNAQCVKSIHLFFIVCKINEAMLVASLLNYSSKLKQIHILF